ncbi:transcriptional coactivator hfi1/ADA1 [Acarospora aff. strigata]|nr:transcriptional coactivator hfi1/ADA1 [Acarospora aff. strigata]
MPDIDPAALSRSDSILPPSGTPTISSKTLVTSAPATQKAAKVVNNAQRIDLEPLYTSLRAAIGEHWVGYKEAISLFVLGHLNQNELANRIDHYITAQPSVEHLHNQLFSAIYGNVTRDLPDQGVASWVSANDKPTVLSKPVSGDAAEQRLKTEVMQLPARDRRRLKDIPDFDPYDTYANTLLEYHQAKQIKLPDIVPASAGGLNKTNWDLEVRKRYSQPLASETGEFPDAVTIHGRMVPICYEESLVSGCSIPCADFMANATETFVKEVLSGIFGRTRSNVPAGSNSGIMTKRYKRQLEKEEEGWLRGEVSRSAGNGMLPVEMKEAIGRRPLGMSDLRLALEIGDCALGQMPLVVERVMGGYFEGELEEERKRDEQLEQALRTGTDGAMGVDGRNGNEPSIDESDWGWEGGGTADRERLSSLLDDCLAIGQ